MSAKFHCPTSTVTLFSEDREGRIHSSLIIESQKSPANSGGTIVYTIIHATLDAEVGCPEGSCLFTVPPSGILTYFGVTCFQNLRISMLPMKLKYDNLLPVQILSINDFS